MPLNKKSFRDCVSTEIHHMMHDKKPKYPHDRAVAASLNMCRKEFGMKPYVKPVKTRRNKACKCS